MLTRHANELLAQLEQVVDVGCVVIRRSLLLGWFGQERMTVGIWRDIQQKWEEILDHLEEDATVPLLAGEADGAYAFAWGEGLSVSDKSWFKDVQVLAKRKNDPGVEAA